MSSTIVIYSSKYGTTELYANWIAKELKADLKKLNASKNNYSKIIKLHKQRLVSYGVMREIKNGAKTLTGRYAKKCLSY